MLKKGFTLIEMLSIITILGIVSLLIVYNIMNYLDRTKEKAYDQMIQNIENVTRLYISNNRDNIPNINNKGSNTYITLEDLVNDGLIRKPVKDPVTGLEIDLNTKIIIYVLGNNQYNLHFEYQDI